MHQHEMHSGSIVEEADSSYGAHDEGCSIAAAGRNLVVRLAGLIDGCTYVVMY